MSEPRVTYRQLVAFAAGDLSADEAAAVERYLAKNPDAAATVARYRQVGETLRADDSQAPPTESMRAAKELFRARPDQSRSGWMDNLKRVLAEMVFDSRPQAALAGIRGRHETYQLSFECDVADVDLEIESGGAEEERRHLRGQVSPHTQEQVSTIALAAPGTFEPVTVVEPDEHGVFNLVSHTGDFDVLVVVERALLVLPDVRIE